MTCRHQHFFIPAQFFSEGFPLKAIKSVNYLLFTTLQKNNFFLHIVGKGKGENAGNQHFLLFLKYFLLCLQHI